MRYRSENFFKEYLKNIPNGQLIQFYNDVEWTPFPVLVLKEYQRRFKTKNKNDVLNKLKTQKALAKEITAELKNTTKARSEKISQTIRSVKHHSNSERNLILLEKLGELKKKGIVSATEFQKKKKELLERI